MIEISRNADVNYLQQVKLNSKMGSKNVEKLCCEVKKKPVYRFVLIVFCGEQNRGYVKLPGSQPHTQNIC